MGDHWDIPSMDKSPIHAQEKHPSMGCNPKLRLSPAIAINCSGVEPAATTTFRPPPIPFLEKKLYLAEARFENECPKDQIEDLAITQSYLLKARTRFPKVQREVQYRQLPLASVNYPIE